MQKELYKLFYMLKMNTFAKFSLACTFTTIHIKIYKLKCVAKFLINFRERKEKAEN